MSKLMELISEGTTDVLPKQKLIEYFVRPVQKCIEIIKKEILLDLNVEPMTCNKLLKIYPILDRVSSPTFKEFDNLPKQLKIYEYTQDNLRYKAIDEDSEIHKIMVLAESKKIDELNKYLLSNPSLKKKEFELQDVLEPTLVDKLMQLGFKFT
jgi:transposase